MTELQKDETEILQKQNKVENYIKEIENLRQELLETKASAQLLNNKLGIKQFEQFFFSFIFIISLTALQEHQNELINDLKSKADQFEQFMKISCINNAASKSNENITTTQKTDSAMQIMEEVARRYAFEAKSIEKSYKDQINNHEMIQASLRRELHNMKTHLQVKTDEIESLKVIILKERAKAKEIIATKEERARKILDRQTEILIKCRLDLQSYQEKMGNLIKDLNEKTGLVNQERESIVLLQQQIVEIKSSFQRKECDLLKKIDNVEQESINKFTHIKEKYLSAKKIAQHYKVGFLIFLNLANFKFIILTGVF